MFKVVWVAGMPRSGSMWTFNVVRELVRHAGFRVLPEEIQLSDQDSAAYANREIPANRDPGAIFILKMHAFLHSLPSNNLVITNMRDIRDALMSFMRFMHVDFDQALGAYKGNMRLADHYLAFPEAQRMILRYEELTASPAETVARIAARMGIDIDDSAADEIAATFSKEKVKALTESKDRQYQRTSEGAQLPAGEILLRRGDGTPATIDRKTGFQSNHVSDYQDGTWRQSLSEDQIGALENTFSDWLVRNGYAV